MPNGSWLLFGLNYSQPVFAVKQIDYDHLYYLFGLQYPQEVTPPVQPGLFYSVIDMDLDGGLGAVVPSMRNLPVPQAEDACEKLHATRHQNNRDVWLVTKKNDTHQYASYLVNSSGISSFPVLSQSMVNDTSFPRLGSMKISQDGKKLAAGYLKHVNNFTPGYVAEFCNFNSTNGIITPLFCFRPVLGNDTLHPYDVEFSPDSKLLYILGEKDPGLTISYGVFQYDATLNDSTLFMESQVVLGSIDSPGTHGLQLAPDGKIYGTRPDIDSLSAINYPNLKGVICGFQKNALSLNGKLSLYGLPQFLQKYKAYIHHSGNCQQDSVHLSADIWPLADSIHWDFGDPVSGFANYSNDSTPTHIYALPGQYTVELFVRHIDNRTDTSWKTIIIHETYQPDLGNDKTICQGDSATFDAGLWPGCTYQWTDISTGLPVGTGQTFTIGQTGNYEVAVTTINGCIGRDTVQLTVTPPPSVTNNPLSKSICSGESTDIPLTSNVPNTTFSWTAIGSSPLVTGFSPGTGDTIDQVLTNSGASPETATYTITPAVGSCVGDSGQYVVTVTPGDSVKVSITASADSVCAGTTVTFTATSTNGGTIPIFQWKVNGLNQGMNDSVFTYAPVNGDSITCILTSSNTICITNNPATSNTIIMTVYPNLPVSISIIPSDNPVCEGIPVTFTGAAVNGGSTPLYQWMVNGVSVGTNDSIFTYTPANGDSVRCILTSSETCTSGNPASSNPVIMTVNPLLPVSITITPSANPACSGIPVTFTATPTNGGSLPGYQWQVNSINAGMNHAVFTYIPDNGDVVTCTLISSEPCTSGNPASSNPVTMSVVDAPEVAFTPCFDTITTLNAKPFKLKGGIPLGGIYSGPGVDQITGYFNPAMAGIGVHQIIYTYMNFALCEDVGYLMLDVRSVSPFSCGDDLLDIRDSTLYPTVQIGTQCWMAANLNYGTEILSTIPQRDNCIPEKYTRPTSYVPRPTFYQWDELMSYQDVEEIQGLCPPGWHVPSEADWNTLFANWTNNAFAGAPLKYSGYSGFNALLTGAQFFNKVWEYDAFATFFWSSTPHGPWKAWAHGMNEYNYSVSYYPSYRANAFSVRCLKDQ